MEKKKHSYKSVLAFRTIQIKGNIGFESFGQNCSGEGLLLHLEMLFYNVHVQCKGISSDAMVKHQTHGCGATCSDCQSCYSFVFFFQNCTDPGLTGREKQSEKGKWNKHSQKQFMSENEICE